MCALNDVTPEEAWTGDKQDISHLHEFGTRVYVLNEGDHLKLDSKATENIFVGFEDGPHMIRYYDPRMKHIKVSRNTFLIEDLIDEHIDIPLSVQKKIDFDLPLSSDAPIEGEHKSEGNHSMSLLPSIPTNSRFEELSKLPDLKPTSPTPPAPPELPKCPTCSRMEINYKHMNEGLLYKPRNPQTPTQQSHPEFLPNLEESADSEEAHFVCALQVVEEVANAFSAPDSL